MLEPRIGVSGDVVHIIGKNFGKEQDESYVRFGDAIPTQSSYLSWSDDLITVRIPDFGESCLIVVHKPPAKSNPVLFSTLDAMPMLPPGKPNVPIINSVEPSQTMIGNTIEITGTGFGDIRNTHFVSFAWDIEHAAQRQEEKAPFIRAFEHQNAYTTWNDRLIQVQVPDGAGSGNIRVITENGESNNYPITIIGKPGKKTIKDKKTYSVSYFVDVRVSSSSLPNVLFLWLPFPAMSSSQLNKELLDRTGEPFIADFRGVSLFKFLDVPDRYNQSVSVSYLVDVYSVETAVQPNLITLKQAPSFWKKPYISPSIFVKSDDTKIQEKALNIVGKETNPYLKARALYNALLHEKSGNTVQDALLFCALYRAVQIPAIPISGTLINRDKQTTAHIWMEFWIDDFGWIPVDILLGKGYAPPKFSLPENYADYYFGSIDNNRIIFSYGETQISLMDANGKTASYEDKYALQNIWEESSSGIKSYSSFWSEINITGIY